MLIPYNILSTNVIHQGKNNKSTTDCFVVIKISRKECPFDETECPLLNFIEMENCGRLYSPLKCPQIFPDYTLKTTLTHYKYTFKLKKAIPSDANEKAQQLLGYIWNHCRICQRVWHKQIKNR